jgi:hypothetical protein
MPVVRLTSSLDITLGRRLNGGKIKASRLSQSSDRASVGTISPPFFFSRLKNIGSWLLRLEANRSI